MIGKGLFTGLLVLFWLAELAFAALVVYWFVSQGFSDADATSAEDVPLESRRVTRNSLLLWAGFFAFILVLIVVGA